MFFAILAGSIGKQLGGELFKPSKSETLSKISAEAAAKINAIAPKKIDELTTLVRAEASMGSKLTMYYTLENFDSYAKDFSLNALSSEVTKNACNQQKAGKGQSPLALGMTYTYVYARENGSVIGKFDVTQQDCYRPK